MESFIHQEYIQDLSLCDELIDYFENSPNKVVGARNGGVDKTKKDSTDCAVEYGSPIWVRYKEQLQNVANSYMEKFPYCNNYSAWCINTNIQVQKYLPGQGYHVWHCERGGIDHPFVTRHLVFMTYLNDVTEGGGTQFFHQNIITPARKGLTVIWPADWTHTHKGEVSYTQTKYIITGWFNYYKKEELDYANVSI